MNSLGSQSTLCVFSKIEAVNFASDRMGNGVPAPDGHVRVAALSQIYQTVQRTALDKKI